MNNKTILLFLNCALLTMSMHPNDSRQEEITKLKLESRQKQKILSELGNKIKEQEDLIFLLENRIRELFKAYVEYRKNDLGEIDDKKFALLNEAFSSELQNFWSDFFDGSKKQKQLEIELHADQPTSHKAILKFNIIKHKVEINLLISLIDQWRECLKNIDDLEKQIESIEQEKN